MALFLQGCGAALLALILILTVGKGKEIGTLLGMGVCCMTALVAMHYLKPVLDFLHTLEATGGLDSSTLRTLLKIVGIGLISEIASLICNDTGNGSLGKGVQLMGTAVILYLSMPLFAALMEMLQVVLGDL